MTHAGEMATEAVRRHPTGNAFLFYNVFLCKVTNCSSKMCKMFSMMMIREVIAICSHRVRESDISVYQQVKD